MDYGQLFYAGAPMITPPPLRDDCFALPAGVDWMPVETALALLKEKLTCRVASTELPLQQAVGRFLSSDLYAQRSSPPHANSAVDGYGFDGTLSDQSASLVLPLIKGRAAAGQPYQGSVPKGSAIQVLTGAALPTGVDTIVLQEDVATDGKEVAFHGPLRQGKNTRLMGEDIREGQVVLSQGRKVTVADLGLLASVGIADLPVHDTLSVGVLSTGDELIEASQSAKYGQIYDANRPMLLGLLRRLGYAAVDLGTAPDDPNKLRTQLDSAVGKCDVILTSGGASAGAEDHMSALLNSTGSMALWRVAVKPGRPLAMGLWQGVPVFGLPGNPVAAFVCTAIFAAPALQQMAGGHWPVPQGFSVPAAFHKSKKPGRSEFLRARIREGRVEAFGSEGSGRISGLSWGEGLVELGEEAATITPGDRVRFIPFNALGL